MKKLYGYEKGYRIRNLKKVLIPRKQYDCSAILVCDCCRVKTTTIKFTMAPPDYKSSVSGCFYGDDPKLCMWYNGRLTNRDWYKDSSFISLCPECQKKCKKKLNIDRITCTEAESFLLGN